MLSRVELKNLAKENINGNVFLAFIATIIPSLLSSIPLYFIGKIEALVFIIGTTNLIISIAIMPMRTGVKMIFLQLSDSNQIDLNNIIEPYKNGALWEIIKAKLLSGLYIILGFICLIVPGIYLALEYAMIDYIIADNKDIKYDEAMRMSAEIMKGQKWRFIELVLSFILWFFAIIFTFGIATVYVAPYFEATITNFYKDIRLTKIEEPEFVENTDYLQKYVSEE